MIHIFRTEKEKKKLMKMHLNPYDLFIDADDWYEYMRLQPERLNPREACKRLCDSLNLQETARGSSEE